MLRQVTGHFCGMGTMIVDFKQVVGLASCRNTLASWSAGDLSVLPGTPSGPAALLRLILFSVDFIAG